MTSNVIIKILQLSTTGSKQLAKTDNNRRDATG